MAETPTPARTYRVKSFGCQMNVYDGERMGELLAEQEAKDFAALGFTDEEAQKLLADEKDQLVVHEIDTEPVHDRFWIAIKGPLRQQAETLQKLQAAMKDLPDVEVQLGTVMED